MKTQQDSQQDAASAGTRAGQSRPANATDASAGAGHSAIFYKDEDSWREDGRKWIGASEAAAIMGEGYANQGAWSVWHSKVYGDFGDRSDATRLQVGKDLEPSINKIVRRECGVKPEYSPKEWCRYVRRDVPLACTPDAVIIDGYEIYPCEYKFLGAYHAKELREGIPLKYQIQVQHQMAVLGSPKALFFALAGHEPMWQWVERDEGFISRGLIPYLVKFWQEHIETRQPPSATSLRDCATVLQMLHPRDNGETVELPGAADDWTRAIAKCDQEIKHLEKQREACRNHLRAAIGDATYGKTPSGQVWAWQHQTRKAYEVKESETRVLRKVKGNG